MMTKHLLMTFAVPIAVAATPAEATIYAFDLTGAYNASFTIDSAALTPPDFSDGNAFIVDDVAGTFAGASTVADSITFNVASFDGGLNIQLGDEFFDFWGAQLFSGTTAAPAFRTGSFTLFQGGDSTLVTGLSVAAVPEPASWAMMIAGFGIAGYAMRRTRARTRLQMA